MVESDPDVVTLLESDYRGWLDRLDETAVGRIHLINIFLAYKHELVAPSTIRAIVDDCLGRPFSDSGFAPATLIAIACESDDCVFASLLDPSPDGDLVLSNVIDSMAFNTYLVDHHLDEDGPKVIFTDKPASRSRYDVNRYGNRLDRVTAPDVWWPPLATLGNPPPDPHFVWVTNEQEIRGLSWIAEDRAQTSSPVRDALGLVEKTPDDFLLLLTFPASSLFGATGVKYGRPAFGAGGRRFATYLADARDWYLEGWGATVDLSKLASEPHTLVKGVRERVTKPLPMGHVGSAMNVEALGWVEGTRGDKSDVDDDVYAEFLRGDMAVDQMKTALARAIATA